MRALKVIALLSINWLASCSSAKYAGPWTLCIVDATGHATCGPATVRLANRKIQRWDQVYLINYTIALDSVSGLVRPRNTHYGSLLVDHDGSLTVQVALANDSTAWEADGGNLSAEGLQTRADTIGGDWYQSCYQGCPAHGRLTLVRSR